MTVGLGITPRSLDVRSTSLQTMLHPLLVFPLLIFKILIKIGPFVLALIQNGISVEKGILFSLCQPHDFCFKQVCPSTSLADPEVTSVLPLTSR